MCWWLWRKNAPPPSPSFFFFPPTDPRTAEYFMISNYTIVIPFILITAYALVFGIFVPHNPGWFRGWPKEMIMTIQDWILGVGNTILASALIYNMINAKYDPWCQPVDASGFKPEEDTIAWLMYMYMIVKMLEWSDSFVVAVNGTIGRRWSLHISHHTAIVAFSLFAVKYLPGGSSAIFAGINSTAHSISYTYQILVRLRMIQAANWRDWIDHMHKVHFSSCLVLCVSAMYKNCGYARGPLTALMVFAGAILSWWLSFPKGGGGGGGRNTSSINVSNVQVPVTRGRGDPAPRRILERNADPDYNNNRF